MNATSWKPPVRRQLGKAGNKRALNPLGPCKRIAVLFVAAFLLAAGPARAEGDGPASLTAFQPGERLTFALKWTIVPAGTAVLEVLPREHMAGLDTFHFVLTARSNAFVDAFYTVRDRVDAWADTAMQRSLLYRKKQREGSTRRDITVSFDWEAMTAQYVNGNDIRDPIAITEGSFDPLSIFYWSRFAPLAVGDRLQRPVTDGKKHVLGIAYIIRRESIRVPAGRFDTFLIEPDLRHVGGVFEKSPEAKLQLWVTADRRRLPVKLKSKVVVGSFTGELTGMIGTVTPAAPDLSSRP
jgi:hypothetical protein